MAAPTLTRGRWRPSAAWATPPSIWVPVSCRRTLRLWNLRAARDESLPLYGAISRRGLQVQRSRRLTVFSSPSECPTVAMSSTDSNTPNHGEDARCAATCRDDWPPRSRRRGVVRLAEEAGHDPRQGSGQFLVGGPEMWRRTLGRSGVHARVGRNRLGSDVARNSSMTVSDLPHGSPFRPATSSNQTRAKASSASGSL